MKKLIAICFVLFAWAGLQNQVFATGCTSLSLSTGATNNTRCTSPCNGAIDLTVSGGRTPYTYKWSNGPTTQDISALCAGSYTVTVTDKNGCVKTKAVTIYDSHTAPSIAATSTNTTSCVGTCNGTINLTVTGGTSPYAYQWNGGGTTASITKQIATGNDDSEEHLSDGSILINGTHIDLGYESSNAQIVGLRFTGLGIPAGAVITSARLDFVAYSSLSSSTNLVIKGEKVDNSSAFTTTAYNLSGKTKTSASVNWSSVPSWTSGTTYSSPDIKTVLNEIISRPGWASGNALALFVTGTGERASHAYENYASKSAKLVLTYTTGQALSGPSLTGLCAGTYAVTVTDALGCTKTKSVVIDCVPACTLDVNAGSDVQLCNSTATLTATSTGASNCSTTGVSDCNHVLAASGGYLSELSTASVCGDDAGAKLWTKGGNGTSYITLDLGASIPAGTQICVRMKLEHCSNSSTSYSNAKIQASTSSGSGFTDLTSSVTFTHTDFQEYCYTLASAARYIKVSDNGNCAFRVDYVKYVTVGANNNTVNYSWSGPGIVGANNTAAISVNQPGTYTVTATDCKGCVDTDQVVVTSCCNLIVNAGNDLLCTSSSSTLTATSTGASNCSTQGVTDCNHVLAASGGYLSELSTASVCGDEAGAKLWTKGNQGTSFITLDLGASVPAGTQICVRMKLEHCSGSSTSYSNAKIQASTSSNANFTNLTASVTFTHTNFQEYCYTLAADARYIRVEDNGNCAFRVDYVKYVTVGTNNNTVNYSWSGPGIVGANNNATISINLPGTYTVTATDCKGCTDTDEVVVLTCNDNNPCTDDLCVNGACQYVPITCNDQNLCTTDRCDAGQCVYTPITCNDQDACTTDGPCVNGECVYTPVTCNDQDACTTDGPCVNGECVYTPITCNDQDACTTDGPCVNGECVYTPITCNDQDACTTDGPCVNGECVYTPVTCNDQDACTTDGPCVNGECVYTPITCNDQDACTTDGPCVNGECVYTPITCNDQDACTTDGPCVNGECVYTPVVCNDRDACTTDGPCVNGECVYTPIVCNDNIACTTDGPCVNGECVYTPGEIDLTTDKTDVTCECIPTSTLCKIDFAGLEHGRIINTQYDAFGVHFSAVANDPGVDTVIIFNSFVTGTTDPDLEVDAGNLAIIPMNISGGADGIVNNPNDNIDGGVITLTFDNPTTVTSFVIVDVDHLDGDPHAIAYDEFDNVLINIAIPILGDGSVQTVVLNQSGVRKLEINTHNSIGVTDFIFDCDTASCCNGTASVEAIGGTGPYTYLWSNDSTTSSIDSLCPGEYCVTVTDVNGCSNVECVLIGEDTCEDDPCYGVTCNDQDPCTNDVCVEGQCQYTVRICDDQDACTLDFCNGGGCVFFEIPGCNDPCDNIICEDEDACTTDACVEGDCVYTPVVCNDNDDCTTDLCVDGECEYTTVTCDDQNICTSDACVDGECEFTPSGLTADATGTNPTACGACDGSATVEVTGGTGPFTYLWSNGATTQTISGDVLPPFNGTKKCINAGGPQHILLGDTFLVDQLYTGIPYSGTYSNNNQNFSIDALYRTERNAVPPGSNGSNGTMTYAIPVINGTYDIELHFAEIFFGVPGGSTSPAPHENKRLFHVAIEGSQVLTNYDIVAEANGPGKPIIETFTVTITDGVATILFTNVPGKNRAKVSAICVKPHQEEGTGSGLCDGNYSVTVTDANGCVATDEVTLTSEGCNDNDPCTTDECQNEECVYTPIVCEDQDGCTTDACVNGECIYTPVTCDDADACTVDACENGECSYTAIVCNDGESCTEDACVNGECEYTQIPGCGRVPCLDDIPCTDSDLCTIDICVDGFCENPTIVCDDQNSCTTDLCVDGDCVYTSITCDDQDGCTRDACVDGECVYTEITCNDQNSCTTELCVEGECEYTDVTCNDNDECTTDACDDGECVFESIPGCGEGDPCVPGYCDDGDPCTVDVLDGSGACTHTPSQNTPDYLKIVNTGVNSNNIKILYGNTSTWVNKNVIAGGNDMLCITLRDATPLPDSVAKVHIRLKGSMHSEGTRITNNYPFDCVPREWTTICIPLNLFPTTNFTALPYVEIFNSAAAAYEFHILKIEFTGGATPFLWYGAGHPSNFVSGNTAAFSGTSVAGTPCNGGAKLSGTELNNTVESFSSEISELAAYPNPFVNQLNVEFTTGFEGTAELKLVDVLGKAVQFERVSVMSGLNKQTMNLDGTLASGVYFLEVRMNDQVRYVKLMK